MSETQILPLIAAAVCAALMLAFALGAHRWRHAWAVPAALSAIFAIISLRAVLIEGPLGFWPEHTRNLWGNQIFLDLLLAATCAIILSANAARSRGMRVWAWVLLILLTGSIGLCAYAARLLYLTAHHSRPTSDRPGNVPTTA